MATAAVKARLKALRKKYGLGEFRKSKKSRRTRRAPSTKARRRSSPRRRATATNGFKVGL